MTLFLALLCAIGALTYLLDLWLLSGAFFSALPAFSATAAAAAGVLIAGLEYRARRSKKKRRVPMVFLTVNALIGVAAALTWLLVLFGLLD